MPYSVEDSPKATSCELCSHRKSLTQRARRLLPLGVLIAGVTIAKMALTGHLLWNITPSIPRGIYWISPGERPERGALVTLPIPESARELLYEREYLPRSVKLLAKPVAAVGGDRVCVRDRRLFINGKFAGNVLDTDVQGRPMPLHATCEMLPADVVFLATHHDNSFDSRNFGPVSIESVRGTLTPLWIF